MSNTYMEAHFKYPYEDDDIKVVFVGDISCTRSYSLDAHKNSGIEINLIAHGKGFFVINGTSYFVNRDSLFVTRQEQSHSAYSSDDHPYRIKYLCLNIKEEASKPWQDAKEALLSLSNPTCKDICSLQEVHSRIIKELTENNKFSPDVAGFLIKGFVLLVIRNFYGINLKNEKGLCEKVIEIIESRLESEFGLKIISKEIGYSIPHISRQFKTQTGFSIIKYYNYMRLERSKTLLREGLSVSVVAQRLVFSDVHHFSRMFKSVYGIPPTNWMKYDDKNVYQNDYAF